MVTEREKIVYGFSVPIWTQEGSYREKPLINVNEYDLRTPKIFIASKSDLETLRDFEKRKWQTFKVDMLPDKVLATPSVQLPINETPAKHPNSESLYYSDITIGDDRYLISYLPPNEWTSGLHWHPGGLRQKWRANEMYGTNPTEPKLIAFPDEATKLTEFYELSFGSAKIHHSEGDPGYDAPRVFSVRSGILHRMEAGSEGAIFGIFMKNAGLYKEVDQHLHAQAA